MSETNMSKNTIQEHLIKENEERHAKKKSQELEKEFANILQKMNFTCLTKKKKTNASGEKFQNLNFGNIF